MAKPKKPVRPKAQKPRGFKDRFGAEIIEERDMLARICAVYEAHGFDPLETPAFEYTDALGKFLPDVERPNQGVFSLTDDDDQWMSLRYDLTAPLARYVAENYDALPKPFRRYAVGPVWRNEKPGPGRFRQFIQCDADTVAAPAPHADIEACAMLGEVMEAVGMARGAYEIKFNDRDVLTGLLETIGIGEAGDDARKLGVFRAMDKLDRLGEAGVAALLGDGRRDDSGDYTEGAGLDAAAIDKVLGFMRASQAGNMETCNALADLIGGSPAGARGVETLTQMTEGLTALGFDESRVRIDLSVIRGLEYYTGSVFEVELKGALEDEKGRPVRIGSVAAGGRYDGLVARFKNVPAPAVGVSVGVSRLLTALSLQGKSISSATPPIVVLALEKDQMNHYQAMAAELRNAGFRAEVYFGGANFAKQLKYADKRNAPIAIIQGEDERGAGEVTLKNLRLGAELSKQIESNEEWRESRRAQARVSRDSLVDAVRDMLAGL